MTPKTGIPRLTLHISMIACRTAKAYGKFSFVGRGPVELFNVGTPEDLAIVAKHGFIPGMSKRVHTRVFETVEEGLAAAKELGVEVCAGKSVGCARR